MATGTLAASFHLSFASDAFTLSARVQELQVLFDTVEGHEYAAEEEYAHCPRVGQRSPMDTISEAHVQYHASTSARLL
jgi:hypothetical protein